MENKKSARVVGLFLGLVLLVLGSLWGCEKSPDLVGRGSGSGTEGGTAGSGTSGSGTGGGAPQPGTVDPQQVLTQGRNANEFVLPSSLHPQGVPLTVQVYLPDGSNLFDTGAFYPVAFGYHGSGGLNVEPDQPGDECTQELETKYKEMTDFLNSQGIAVVWVDSFFSRDHRFCEDSSNDFKQFAPDVMDNDIQQVLSRMYDTVTAEVAFCALNRFDCGRFLRIGTSEGGTAAIFPSHRYLDYSLSRLFAPDSSKLDELKYISYAALPANRPQPKFIMAISPGCGFYGAIPFSADGDIKDLFYPEQDVYLEIGGDDNVPAECSVAIEKGRRQLQAEAVQKKEGISTTAYRYHVTIYPGGHHELWDEKKDVIKAKMIPLIQEFFQ